MIRQPIFIVGSGRSGSTLFYRILCGHSDLAWFSSFTDKYPRVPGLAFFSRFYKLRQYLNLPRYLQKLIPVASEGYAVWDLCKPVIDSPSDPPLTKNDIARDDKNKIRKMILAHMKYQGGKRFINKNTRNTRRIGYLNALFPDALFIHIVRDPRASVASLMKVYWWPDLQVWNQDKVTPKEWEASGRDPIRLAANLWADETQLAMQEAASLGDRYKRVFYEDLIENPQKFFDEIFEFCGLAWNTSFENFLKTFVLKDMNTKYKSQLSYEQIKTIEAISASTLEKIGNRYY